MNKTLKWPYAPLLLGYCVGIFLLSHQSDASVNKGGWVTVPRVDKVAHAILYGGLHYACHGA
jgi:hypothetical protein